MWCAILISAAFLCVAAQPPPGGYYTTRYDHIDIERILNQKRLVNYYAECLLERGPCTPQGVEFKHILPEALRTNCMRCTEKQHFVTVKTIRRLRKEYPDVWAELAQIWDPTGEFTQRLEESLNKKYNRFANISQSSTSANPPIPTAVPLTVRKTDDEDSTATTLQVPSSLVANKPLSFSVATTTTTTRTPEIANKSTKRPIEESTPPLAIRADFNLHNLKTTTKQVLTSILQEKERLVPTTHRISYNYDFAASINTRPLANIESPVGKVIRGVNHIIQPITDIAGRVFNAGTDIAGAVLHAIGLKRVK